jgi:hypothetical protein
VSCQLHYVAALSTTVLFTSQSWSSMFCTPRRFTVVSINGMMV